jgi:hypothetical protein
MPPVRSHSFTSRRLGRRGRIVLAALAGLVAAACSAGGEGSGGSLSAGPYMPGADATGDTGTRGESDGPESDGDETSGGAMGSSSGDPIDPTEPVSESSTGVATDDSTGDAPPTMSCGELAQMQGFVVGACEHNGNGACGGVGTPTTDCDLCCDVCPAGNSCGALAQASGWAAAACETPGNPACGGMGTPTCDCTVCCEQ